jgi:general secretion pathway protein A
LRRLNRPAVLQLRSEQGQEFFATLTALQGRTATVVIGEETKAVAVSALASRWSGHYTLLWQAPSSYQEVIRAGSRGPAVAWLSRQIALAQGQSNEGEKDSIFADTLLRQVKEFQLGAGLVPDGVVGPQTLIHLDTVLGGTSPKLVEPQKGG